MAISYDQALSNLQSGGLRGQALQGAISSLNNYYSRQGTQTTQPSLQSTPSKPSTVLNASTLSAPISPITVPPKNPTVPAIAPAVSNPSGTTVDANGTATVPPPVDQKEPQSTSDWIKEQFKSLGNTLGTKSKVTQDLQSQQQLAKKTEQATTDYNAYVAAKTNQAQTLEKMYEDRTTGVSAAGANASISDYERKGNANLANLAIVAQASQGLLSAAQQTIKDKIDAQFQPIQDQIDFLTKFATVNNNDLTESEKFKLQEQADQKKTDLANVSKTADDLHQALLDNNAPQTVYSALDKITNDYVSGKISAQDAQSQMYRASGNYGVSIDTQYKRAQLQKIQAEAADLVGNGNNRDLTAYASDYATTGKLPTPAELKLSGLNVDQVSALGMEMPKTDGTLVSQYTGVKNPALSSTQEDGITSLYDLTKKLNDFSDLYSQRNTLFPTKSNQQLNDLRGEIVDLLARARTGAAISESELALYEKKLPSTKLGDINLYPQTKITDLKNSISGKLDTALNTTGSSIYGYSKVKVPGDSQPYRTVGDVIEVNGTQYRVLPNGKVTTIL